MTEEEAEVLAREIIAEIAVTLKYTPESHCVEQSGNHIFVFTVSPCDEFNDGHPIKRPPSDSVFHFNPLGEAIAVVLNCAFQEGLDRRQTPRSDADVLAKIRYDAGLRICQIIALAPTLFQQAMWQARVIASPIVMLPAMQAIGRHDIAKGLVNATVRMIEGRIRDLIGKLPDSRNPLITPVKVDAALNSFLPAYRQSGSIPSRNKFAQALGVTTKAWRDCLRGKLKSGHEEALRHWLQMLSAEQEGGEFVSEETPQGIISAEKVPN